MTQLISIEEINALEADAFVSLLGGVYEHSPWVAEAVVDQRPFASKSALQQAMKSVVDEADDEARLQLLKAHPEFAGKPSQTLTASSTSEQGRLSLNNLPADQHMKMQGYNRQFMDKFGFPGIVAVRLNNSVEQIFQQFEQRLGNDLQTEMTTAIQQVHSIVDFRLRDIVAES